MPRTRVTLADLRQRLKERVGDNSTFWKDEEVKDAINEAIAVWQALAGEWTTRISIPAVSDSPSFYPVAKQIVSLTRVGVEPSDLDPPHVKVRIAPNNVVRNTHVDPTVYHTASTVVVVWNAIAVNGVAPYRYTWTFPTDFVLEPYSTIHDRSPAGRFVVHCPDPVVYDIECTATDSADETHTAFFSVTVIDPVAWISFGSSPTPVG